MPTKNELQKEIRVISTELEVELPEKFDKLSNKKLSAALLGLKTQARMVELKQEIINLAAELEVTLPDSWEDGTDKEVIALLSDLQSQKRTPKLRTEASELATELEIALPDSFEDLNSSELNTLYTELLDTKRERAKEAKKTALAGAKAEEAEKIANADKNPIFLMAPGRSMMVKRGTVNEGDEIRAEDLPGGMDELLEYYANKQVVVKK